MRDGVVPDRWWTSHFRFEAVCVPSALFWNLQGVKTIHIYDSGAAVSPPTPTLAWHGWPPGRR
ncbi:hypothetical protein [Mycobacterium scrofulaceum]|uniref:hypothetical protein n=1 Tax=Mycobacterium scrofulaceum TaxID=1783 RepID=UPI0012EAA2D4|nr:hypothetical protein [Mycobacterium scrofulaceum]